MDLGYFIGDLLRERDEVCVPGLGTFFKLRVPGFFDPGVKRILPPSYQLAFNKNTESHNTLAEYVSSQKNLSLNSAEYFVKKFSANILEQLQQSGTAEIKPLGLMHQNNDELTFENAGNSAFSDDFFGLQALEYSGILEQPAVETFVNQPPSSTIEDFISGAELENQGDETEDSEIEDSTPARFSPLLASALIIAVLVLAGYLLYRYNPGVQQWVDNYKEGSTQQAAPEPAKQTSPAVVADSSLYTPDTVSQSAVNSSPDSVPIQTPVISEPEFVYEIVVATFGRRADAEQYIRELASKKINAHIASNIPGPKIKVSVASISDKNAADKEFARVRKELNKEAWMQLVPKIQNP